jgi:hypothetical protein
MFTFTAELAVVVYVTFTALTYISLSFLIRASGTHGPRLRTTNVAFQGQGDGLKADTFLSFSRVYP